MSTLPPQDDHPETLSIAAAEALPLLGWHYDPGFGTHRVIAETSSLPGCVLVENRSGDRIAVPATLVRDVGAPPGYRWSHDAGLYRREVPAATTPTRPVRRVHTPDGATYDMTPVPELGAFFAVVPCAGARRPTLISLAMTSAGEPDGNDPSDVAAWDGVSGDRAEDQRQLDLLNRVLGTDFTFADFPGR